VLPVRIYRLRVRFSGIGIALLINTVLCAAGAFADSQHAAGQGKTYLSPELLAQGYPIPKNSPWYPLLLKRLRNPEGWSPDPKVPIVQHIRGKKVGLSFVEPPQEKRPSGYDAHASVNVQPRSSLTKRKKEALKAELRDLFTPKRLDICRSAETNKIDPASLPFALSAEELNEDVLILSETSAKESDFISQTFDELFGRKTKVRYYTTRFGDADALRIYYSEIGCLPIRYRGSGDSLYLHVGADALRNYDADPNGKGTLHPALKMRASEFLR
jgi:hypothetical protein